MKKIKSITLLLTICSVATSINAYENSFFNNTDEPIGIAIQYTGNVGKEPLYKQLVKPKSMNSFVPGEAKVPAIKLAFCLDKIYYIKNPTPEQKAHNFEKAVWKEIPITWTKAKSSTKKQDPKQSHIKKAIKKPVTAEEMSLCRKRHFDITRDEHDKIFITSSLID